MTTPVVLVAGLAPPPLGSEANGTKALGSTPVLSLQSTLGFSQLHWALLSVPSGSTCALGTPTPSLTSVASSSNCTMGPLDKRGTYLASATVDGVVVEFAVAVLTARGLIRIPALGETTQWNPSGFWQKSIYDALLALDGAGSEMRFGMQGNAASDQYIGNATQQNAHAKVARPIAVATTFTKMRIRLQTALGIGGSATFTVYDRFGATALTGTMVEGDIDKVFTYAAGVAFADTNSMSVLVHVDVGTVTSPEIVVF